MKVLLNHVDYIEYEPVAKEIRHAEEAEKARRRLEELAVLFTTVESGDDDGTAKAAVGEISASLERLGVGRVLVYPFAHLSRDLAPPAAALSLLKAMESGLREAGLETHRAPFGWNKALVLSVKGHPLAEQSKSFGGEEKKEPRKVNTSAVKKSDWVGLPETDHRSIGEKLDLFSFQEVSPAMVYWHPKGYTVYKELLSFLRRKETEYGYQEISTPALANIALWQVSGHIDHYRENMFVFKSDFGELGLKPMNCPSTMLIYKSRKWSYRELPFRTAIFDKLYRKEVSGALSGLFRVQELTQDDGHIFVAENQLGSELALLLKFVKEVYDTFGLRFTAKLSTMPEDHMGDKSFWDKATAVLEEALKVNKLAYEVKEGEGAFYGPKIDFDVFD
ncbi:MAG: threonine--tRNA ligase, partial [Nitrososphaerota archaeon]|nr:threonine--tRNA ligase [Nitrososphaerota archaeon]